MRGDGAMEAGFRLPLTLHLLDHAAGTVVPGLAGEHGAQMRDGARRVIAMIVEMREQHAGTGVELEGERTLERAERLVRAARVHGGDAEPLQERGRLRRRV